QCICGFVVDLYCACHRIAIELDGGVHDDPEQARYDEMRDRALAYAGISIVRIRNEHVSRESLQRAIEEMLVAKQDCLV
ncbi:MAG: DUF559 domain-containing protein, partial [Deltaproteobacteria bacterium]|nr:DUF559 domain-containing protein [Deltaproteobacteria bacterium]